jgi:orotate phosphoribosyltransferase
MQEKDILAMYENAGALLSGHFVLSSGRHSSRYLQSARVLMHPEHAAALAGGLAARIDADEVDLVISPALGGLIIGHEVAQALGKTFIFTERKEGAMCLRRGFEIDRNARVLVVEDVITTGGSVNECIEVIREHCGRPFQIMALVDRAPDMQGRFDVPHLTLLELNVESFAPDDCPMCKQGVLPPVKPGSRGG